MATAYTSMRKETPPAQPKRGDLIRASIGWSALVAIITFLSSAHPLATATVPWTLAWILYLPSMITVINTIRDPDKCDRTIEMTMVQAGLALIALLFIVAAIMMNPVMVQIEGCIPGFADEILANGVICPNVFEYRWGHAGKVMPVAFAVITTSLLHMIWLAFTFRHKFRSNRNGW